jgi:hypothetical protein
MTRASVRTAAVVVAMLSVGGCSFQASVHEARGASTSAGRSASATAGTTAGSATGSRAPVAEPTRPAAASTSGTPSGPDRCHTGDLTASLVPGSPGAGQRYATLSLTDRGGSPCTVFGFGGLGLVGSGGESLPTRQVRVLDPAPATVALQPGGSVSAQLHWGAVAGPGDALSGNCQPVPSTLRVIPPDETEALSVPWGQGPVCEGGTIQQQAYAA